MARFLSRLLDVWPITVIGLGLVTIVVLFYGCESRPVTRIPADSEGAASDCVGILENGMAQIRPENLGVVGSTTVLNFRPFQAADKLTQWLRRPDCQAATPVGPVDEEATALLRRLVGPETTAALLDEELDAFNAADLRDALLNYETAQSLTGGVTDDLERVRRLFHYVARVISPEAASSVDLRLSGYEAELLGRGSAESRAWLFAGLLRQLRIDAIILRPAAGDGTAGEASRDGRWWVGVPVGGEVYLFDCELGLPVPAPDTAWDGQAIFPRPATWSQAIAAPELLTEYLGAAGVETEPIAAARLKPPRVELIGPRTHWKKSIERIELSFRSELGVLLYDPLQDTTAVTGLFGRIVELGEGLWPAESIGVWSYPAKYRQSREAMVDANRRASERKEESSQSPGGRRLDQRIAPYLGPVVIKTDGPRPGLPSPSKDLWAARIRHIAGAEGGAIQNYLGIRDLVRVLRDQPESAGVELPAGAQSLNRASADEASYWGIHAQFRSGSYETALANVESYRNNGGDRSNEAEALGVLCLAKLGRWDEAVKAARKLPANVPGRARFLWLAKWWDS